MLTSILNIYAEFFKLFGSSVSITDGLDTVVFPVHFAKDSKNDFTQNFKETYPQISIIDFAPEINPSWAKSYQKKYDGFHKKEPTDETFTMGYEIEEPVLFDFKFDVTAFCKNAIHKWLIWEWFAKNFDADRTIVFNSVLLESPQEDTLVGDPVDFKMTTFEPYRTDGVFELTFNFKITAMVQIVEPKEVELLQTLLIRLTSLQYNN